MINKTPPRGDEALFVPAFPFSGFPSRGAHAERRRWREERGAGGAAVEKRKDKRKPEAFFGYRKRIAVERQRD